MSKAKGIRLVNGKRPLRKLVTTAVEYDDGELYLDRCGRVLRLIKGLGTGWHRQKANPTSAVLFNAELQLTADVSSNRVALTCDMTAQPSEIEDEQIDRYAAEVASVLAIVVDELEISAFDRIGYREVYHFPADSVEDTEDWVRSLGLFQVCDEVYRAFGETHYALGGVVVVAGLDCRYRIEVRGSESPAKIPLADMEVTVKESEAKRKQRKELLTLLKLKRERQLAPDYAGVVDIDAFLWDRMDPDFVVADFVRARAATSLDLFRRCVTPTKKG